MIRVGILCIAVSCLGGCAPRVPPREDLMTRVRQYTEGLRWRRYEDAAMLLAAVNRESFLEERDDLDEDLRIDATDIIRVRVGGKGDKAEVRIRYGWYLNSEGLVKKTTALQEWEKRSDRWVLVTEVLHKGEPMPGLGEKDETADLDEKPEDSAEDGKEAPDASLPPTSESAP